MNTDVKADDPLIKGAALLGFYKYLKSQPEGEALLEKVLSALPPDTQKLCRRKVIAVAEYTYQVFIDFIKTADRIAGNGDLSVCWKLGQYAAARDIQALIAMTKKKPEPEDLLVATDLLWKNYHLNSGEMKVDEATPERLVIRIYNFPRMDPAHCRLMEGYLGQALREAGMSWVQEIREVKCMSRGEPYHEFVGIVKV